MKIFPVWSFLSFNLFMGAIAILIWWLVDPSLTIVETVAQICFFLFMTGLILAAGYKTIDDPNPNLFTGLILGSVLGKLILSLIFLLIYSKTCHPEGKSFLVLFFVLYIGYTTYEIRSMIRLARKKRSHA